MTPDHVKQVQGTEYVSVRPMPKTIRQVIRQEKPAYANPHYRTQTKPTESHTQIYPRETKVLDIDSLEHNINVNIEENSPLKNV